MVLININEVCVAPFPVRLTHSTKHHAVPVWFSKKIVRWQIRSIVYIFICWHKTTAVTSMNGVNINAVMVWFPLFDSVQLSEKIFQWVNLMGQCDWWTLQKLRIWLRPLTCDIWNVTDKHCASDFWWNVTCDCWNVTCDWWNVTCDCWNVTCDIWIANLSETEDSRPDERKQNSVKVSSTAFWHWWHHHQ